MRKLWLWIKWLLSPSMLRAGERVETGDLIYIKGRTVYRVKQERQP
jgi:hypothetical protein